MTDDELRRTAVLIERTDHDAIDRAAAYLRACADALEAGPAAWTDGCGSAVTRAETKGREPHEFTADQDMLAYRIPLYPLAMPAPASDLSEGQYRDMLDAESAPYPVAIRTLLDRLRAAERRAEHWKAEHLAGNAEIEQLRAALRTLIDQRDGHYSTREAWDAARNALENTDAR